MQIQEEALLRLRNNDLTLTRLGLEYNQLGAAGAKDLALALEKNTTLTQLDLGYNQIDAAGTKDLALALEKNTTLTQLNLMGNQIGAAGAKDLTLALKKTQRLFNSTLGITKSMQQEQKTLLWP